MSEPTLEALLSLVDRKARIERSSSWAGGSSTYIAELKKEIAEVEAEIGKGRAAQLSDELGDVLWDYLNLVRCLSAEEGISMKDVLERVTRKYEERVSGLEQGRAWSEIKEEQKARLLQESRDMEGDV